MTDGTARALAGQPGLRHHLLFMAGSALALLMLFTLLRLALLLYNRELLGDASLATLLEGFGNGLRFDLRLLVYICVPLSLAVLSRRAMAARKLQRLWLAACASLVILLGMVELNFYQEFHQRLNSLVLPVPRRGPGDGAEHALAWLSGAEATECLGWADTALVAAARLARPPLPATRWAAVQTIGSTYAAELALARCDAGRAGPDQRGRRSRHPASGPAATLGRCLHHRLGVHQPARPEPGTDALRGGEEPLFRSSRQCLEGRAA